MTFRPPFLISLALVLLSATCLAGELEDAQQKLKDAGLVKIQSLYLLDVDQHLADRLRDITAGERQMATYTSQRRAIQDDINKAQDTMEALYKQMADADAERDRQGDPEVKNRFISQHNTALAHLQEGERFIDKRKADLAALKAPTDYIDKAIRLADDMDAAQARYDELAKDQSIVHAIDQAGAGGPKLRLGPSPIFKQNLQRLRTQRDKYKTAAIKLNVQGGVPTVQVTLNGKNTVPMIVDSGASYVSLTYSIATAAGLKPAPADPKVRLTLANGRTVDAQLVTAPEIQVGRYAVKNVACVVLPAGMDESAGCLLGGSFMKNFMYQMDLNAAVLNLQPISSSATLTAASKSTATTSPAVHNNADGSFTLTISATVDGGDTVRISGNGLLWSHNFAAWPSEVKANETRWDPQNWPTITSDGDFIALKAVDFASAKLVSQSGRGPIEFKATDQNVSVSFADYDDGVDHYSVTISFPAKTAVPK